MEIHETDSFIKSHRRWIAARLKEIKADKTEAEAEIRKTNSNFDDLPFDPLNDWIARLRKARADEDIDAAIRAAMMVETHHWILQSTAFEFSIGSFNISEANRRRPKVKPVAVLEAALAKHKGNVEKAAGEVNMTVWGYRKRMKVQIEEFRAKSKSSNSSGVAGNSSGDASSRRR